MDLHCYLAKRILPKIKAYRDNYLEREVREIPPELLSDDLIFHNTVRIFLDEEISNEENLWITVMNEIIFAMRWILEADIITDTPEKIAFFKEYYGRYIAYEDDEQKHYEQTSDAEKRAQKGFELFGKFFTRLWY
jgi:hypothetical protein